LGALAGGALQEVNGLWRMPKRPPLSASLIEAISARLAGLTAAELRVLELLALGEPLRSRELVELADGEAASATEALALISIQGSDREREVRLSHPLYGETVRSGLGTLRASELRLALAACVQARGELTPADSLRVARWLQDAGAAIPNALLLDAARAANLSGDPELGAELAARALEAGAGPDAALVLARCDQVRKRFAEAESVLAGIEGKIESQDTAIAYLEQRVSALYWGLRRPEEAQALLARALDWWPDEEWVRRLLPIRLHLSSLVGGKGSAVTMSAVLLYDEGLDAGVRRDLEVGHAMSLFATGRVLHARELLRRLRPELPLTGHGDELALAGLGVVEIHSGVDLARIEREMTHTLTEAVRLGDHGAAGVAAMVVGSVASLAGRYRDATRWLSEAELHYEQQDTFGVLVIARQALVSVARQTGNADRTIETARRCLDALQGRDPLPTQVPYVARVRAWEAEARGDLISAQRILRDTADELSDDPLYRALMFYEAMRVGASARPLAAAMAAMRSRCDAPLVRLYIDHVDALARGDGRALLEVADGFAHLGARGFGTEAAAHASAAFMDEGRQDSARRAVARARDLFIDGQGGVMPAIAVLDGSAVELTSREAQLVALARQRLSNAQIAERLVLSVRTVESHLYRAMQKLGVSDRHDL
ncbi:MAG: response regulator transcription factor, partial [Solirubrobacteraceae bacterium]